MGATLLRRRVWRHLLALLALVLTLNDGAGAVDSSRTAGVPLELPAYENDVLNALARSGGLPAAESDADQYGISAMSIVGVHETRTQHR